MTWDEYSSIHMEINDYLEQNGLGLNSSSPERGTNQIKCWISSGKLRYYVDITEQVKFELNDSIGNEVMKFARATVEIWNSPLSKALRE